jgi:ferredoxin
VAEWIKWLRVAPTDRVLAEIGALESGPKTGLRRLKWRLAMAVLGHRTPDDDVRAQAWTDQGVVADWMRCTQCGRCVDQELECPAGHADPLELAELIAEEGGADEH